MKKRMGKWGETCRELPLSGFLSHLVTSFYAVEIGSVKMSKYLVHLINSKTTCDCLTWIVLYKELG